MARMGEQQAVSAEYAEGITQNEAAASAAVTEAQQQVHSHGCWGSVTCGNNNQS